MKLALVKREQQLIVLVAVLAVVIGWVYAVYIIAPLMRQASDVDRQLREGREKVKALELAVANENTLQAQFQQWDEKVKALRSRLPSDAELPSVIEFVSGLAGQTGVKIQTIFPQRPKSEEAKDKPSEIPSKTKVVKEPEPAYYQETLIQIEALAGYHQLGSFLNLVESAEKPIRIQSLRIVSTTSELSTSHRIKLVLRAYLATNTGLLPPKEAKSS